MKTIPKISKVEKPPLQGPWSKYIFIITVIVILLGDKQLGRIFVDLGVIICVLNYRVFDKDNANISEIYRSCACVGFHHGVIELFYLITYPFFTRLFTQGAGVVVSMVVSFLYLYLCF